MKRTIAAAALVSAVAALGAGSAAATPTGKLDSQVIANVRIDPNDATVGYVTARYICQGGEAAHVWVSVKQAESRRPESWLTKEGSGAASAAWSHSHANAVICDGAWHVQTFRVDQREWGWGMLEAGQAWVQFCVIPPGGDPEKVRSPGAAGSRRSSSRHGGHQQPGVESWLLCPVTCGPAGGGRGQLSAGGCRRGRIRGLGASRRDRTWALVGDQRHCLALVPSLTRFLA